MISVSTSQFHLVKTAGNVRHQKKMLRMRKKAGELRLVSKGYQTVQRCLFCNAQKHTHIVAERQTDRQTVQHKTVRIASCTDERIQ